MNNDTTLSSFLEDRLSYELPEDDDFNIAGLAEDLAYSLKINGYCSDPYFEYAKALICPINKKRKKYCGCTTCESHEFCLMLRKEGYV